MESVFAGEPVDLTVPGLLWLGDFRPASEIPPSVRHAAGYAAFVDHVVATDQDPVALAGDVRVLVDYLRQHREALRGAGDDLLDSAGMFLGNALIARVENGRWQRMPPGELEVTQGGGGAVVLRMIRALIDADDGRLSPFDDFLRHWDGSAAASRSRAAADLAAQRRLELLHSAVVPATAFEAPQDASLVELLRALIDYLTKHYRATATGIVARPGDPSTSSPTIETIQFRPDSPDGAPMLISIDDVGAIAMRAGAFNEFHFYGPSAADLQSTLLAIAAGRYRETAPRDANGVGGYSLEFVDRPGGFSTRGPVDSSPDELTAIAKQLDAVPNGWAPWLLRNGHQG